MAPIIKHPYISEEEHQVNLLILQRSEGSMPEGFAESIVERIRKHKHIGKGAESIINDLSDVELKRIILDLIVSKGIVSKNDIFYSIYQIHAEWWNEVNVPF